MNTLTTLSRSLQTLQRATPRQFTRNVIRPTARLFHTHTQHIPKITAIPGGNSSSNTTGIPFLSAAILASLSVITTTVSCDEEQSSLFRSSDLDQNTYNSFTKNGSSTSAVGLINKFFDLNIPERKRAFMIKKFNKFLIEVNKQIDNDSEKKIAVSRYIKGYSHFFNHYEKFPAKLKNLFDTPKIMDACDNQLYHITGVTIPDKNIVNGVIYHKTSPTKKALDDYSFYKDSVKILSDSGITSLDGGRGKVHIPWSLSASKTVMGCIEKAKEEAINDITTHYSGDLRDQKINDLNTLFEKHIDTLSNCILHLVFWAVIVDDIPDKMSKEMPKEMNQTLLNAMKLISNVDTRKKFSFDHPEDIFTTHDNELQKIKEVLQDIKNNTHRLAAEKYVEGAYTSFHNAWDSFSNLAELNSDHKNVLIRNFNKIMISFQHALDVNYDPKPFNIQKAEDVHYGMHMVVFYEMALASAEVIRSSSLGTSYIESHEDDFIEIFRRQSLLMQQMGSISNLICTGVSSEGDVSRELYDGDFSNQLVFDALNKLLDEKGYKNKKVDSLKNSLDNLTRLKEMKRNWFVEHGLKTDLLPKNVKDQKESIDMLWETNVNELSVTISDVLPDLFQKWFSLYIQLKNYDENEAMSDSAIIFLFQNIVVKGKL
jgi:hypothetical protein